MDRPQSLPWLLLAAPQLQDPNFKKSVVLIVEHAEHGSLGFVINRPIRTSLADLVSAPHLQIPGNVPAWFGGPVEKGSGIILHDRTAGAERRDDCPVSLALSSSETALTDLVDHSRKRQADLAAKPGDRRLLPDAGLYPYRFLVGYAGWGAGQLMAELQGGAWIEAKATWRLLFNTRWEMLWDEALGTAGASPRSLAAPVHQYLH